MGEYYEEKTCLTCSDCGNCSRSRSGTSGRDEQGRKEITQVLPGIKSPTIIPVQQRAARPLENGLRPGAAASVRPDVAAMTRAQREALERRVLHGAQIEL